MSIKRTTPTGRKVSVKTRRRRAANRAQKSLQPGAAAYIRVSTEGQAEQTGLEAQRKAIVAYAAANGIPIQTWLSDVESGAKESRPGLERLREGVASGKIDQVLIYRIDRLARDVRIGETVYRELTTAGARVVSVSEAMLDSSLTGNLMRTLVLAFAEYERSLIALRTTAGRRIRVAQQGTFAGGIAPYGYKAVGTTASPGAGALKIDPKAAEAVRRVFMLREAGESLAGIAGQLNAENYRTARGSMFAPEHIRRILARRDVYAGVSVVNTSIPLSEGVKPIHRAIL
jgi:site-specific DNA recombinase